LAPKHQGLKPEVFVKTFIKLPTPAGGFKDNGQGYADAAQALADYIHRQMAERP